MNKLKRIKIVDMMWVSLLVMVLLLFGWMASSLAREGLGFQVNLNELVSETQKGSQKPDEITLIWWIPEEFWRESFAQDNSITSDGAEEFIKILRPYTLVALVDGKMGTFGGITYRSEADVRKILQIKDRYGTYYSPLGKDKIDSDTSNFLAMMKPMIANILGPMGQNMNFFVFPARDNKGQKIVEAKKKGTFSIKLGENEYRWRLPLSSLLPPKICPRCKEIGSGAWNFCPWCGTELPKSTE